MSGGGGRKIKPSPKLVLWYYIEIADGNTFVMLSCFNALDMVFHFCNFASVLIADSVHILLVLLFMLEIMDEEYTTICYYV